jgi:CRP-like cAMP-binding protein
MARLLAGSQLFEFFPTNALSELAAQAVVRHVKEKEVIFEKGMPGAEMFAIVHGRVKISAFSEDGKEVIFAIFESGDFFGETALFDGQPRSATCTSIEDSLLVSLPRQNFIPFLEKHPQLAIHLLALLSKRLRDADEYMEDLAFFPLATRLARKLVALADEHGDVVGPKIEIAMNISQHELANMVSASRESVNKQLAQWTKSGIITISQRLIVIDDTAELHKIAKMDWHKK